VASSSEWTRTIASVKVPALKYLPRNVVHPNDAPSVAGVVLRAAEAEGAAAIAAGGGQALLKIRSLRS